ncbi:hypothetical protein [Bacillus rubiinfantis]|uniref:hypothetical protein n=1 Tax=Bacillus rubiinfantis TaxID=1499680 RepID=UPI0005AAD15D|nr:hypothetical protein [Bacillus rubiinfantis]
MELKELIASLKSDFPKKAIDVSESLELLSETINDTMNTVNEKINEAFLKRDFESREHYNQIAMAIYKYEQIILNTLTELELDPIAIEPEETSVEKEKRELPNYSEFYVDTNVEHTLYEDFTHKRPCGFRVNQGNIIEVSTWKEMLVKTCEILLAVDQEKFMSFEEKSNMRGKKRKYFSTNPAELFNPLPVSGKIYVETHMSSNGFRNLLVKLLKEYGYKINEYKVFLRADYSEMNR